jgi:four helix bundle protein
MRNDDDLRDRTKQFSLRVIRLFGSLPKTAEAQVIGRQLLRSGTSVAANYREAGRGRSKAEVISKLGIVEQELDESMLWLELLTEGGIVSVDRLSLLMQETNELISIIVASAKRMKSNKN